MEVDNAIAFENPRFEPPPIENAETVDEMDQSDCLEPDEASNEFQNVSNTEESENGLAGQGKDLNEPNKSEPEPIPTADQLRNCCHGYRNLPNPLLLLFHPLKCNLCYSVMGSDKNARDHYGGRKHKANVKRWIYVNADKCEETTGGPFGSPSILRERGISYCDICKLTLSSDKPLETHIAGKKHQAVLKSRNPKNPSFQAARARFLEIHGASGTTDISFGESDTGLPPSEIDADETGTSADRKFICTLCLVVCPSEEALAEHISNHKKQMEFFIKPRRRRFSAPTSRKPKNRVNGHLTRPSYLSFYKTPFKKYYCQICDTTVSSTNQFYQHLGSRKHNYKVSIGQMEE